MGEMNEVREAIRIGNMIKESVKTKAGNMTKTEEMKID